MSVWLKRTDREECIRECLKKFFSICNQLNVNLDQIPTNQLTNLIAIIEIINVLD